MTIGEIKRRAKECGSPFFDPSMMRFFGSRVSPRVQSGPGGIFFVTSEQFESSSSARAARRYTVKEFHPDRCRRNEVIGTRGAFQQYVTASAAHRAARKFAKGG